MLQGCVSWAGLSARVGWGMAIPDRRKVWARRATVAAVTVSAGLAWASGCSSGRRSTCFGSPSKGALRDAWKLPRRGPNFRAYSTVGWLLGRTFVHSSVRVVLLDAYSRLEASSPELELVYGETGFERGGRFRPHRTHQNGLSVDFMVPVRDSTGSTRDIPTAMWNKFGYGLEFDAAGTSGELHIDFEAIALHLAELKRSAAKHDVRIGRVIFDPRLRERLATTKGWRDIADLPFMAKPAWIRHDEHYHVDFEVPCQPLGALDG
jgi:penicillin-insensitive murein endopeptidase